MLSFGQAGYDVDGGCDDHGAHGEREPGVPQRGPAYLLGLDVGVGDLEGHADREGQVGEVAVVRGGGLVEVDASGVPGVVQACVSQRVHRVYDLSWLTIMDLRRAERADLRVLRAK